jgi:hypothetical protein
MVAAVDTMKHETRLFINNEFVESESGKEFGKCVLQLK